MIGRGVRQFEIGSQNTCTTKGLLKEKVKRRKQKRARTYATECRISIVNERLIFRFLRRYRSVFVSAVRLKRKIGGKSALGVIFFFSFFFCSHQAQAGARLLLHSGFLWWLRLSVPGSCLAISQDFPPSCLRLVAKTRGTRRGKKTKKKKKRVRGKSRKITIFVWNPKSQK